MGTRSLTFVYDERGEAIINLYRQYDGYPSGHGQELAQFLAGKRIVNGLSGDTSMLFNGMGCLAASVVSHFKDAAGGFYLHPVSHNDCCQDYEYHVYEDRVVIKAGYGDQFDELFSGDWDSFNKFCGEEELV
ncbi:MAG: hypothetical protein FJ211_09910 [Ignavibacteria bacterium]|nr:hypothetical protein [Ignavibacteria bacterium]